MPISDAIAYKFGIASAVLGRALDRIGLQLESAWTTLGRALDNDRCTPPLHLLLHFRIAVETRMLEHARICARTCQNACTARARSQIHCDAAAGTCWKLCGNLLRMRALLAPLRSNVAMLMLEPARTSAGTCRECAHRAAFANLPLTPPSEPVGTCAGTCLFLQTSYAFCPFLNAPLYY